VLRGPAHQVSAERPVLTPADPGHVTAVLATAPAQQAVRTFGPVQTVAHHVGTEVLMLTHTRPGFFTFVDDSPAALGTGNPTALSLQMSTDGESAIRYFTTGGLPLAQLTVSPDGGVSAGPVPDSAAVLTSVTTGEPEVPEISRKLECFIGCIGARASAQCLSGCLGCFNPMPALQKAVCFAACAACAGPHGLGCAAECAQA